LILLRLISDFHAINHSAVAVEQGLETIFGALKIPVRLERIYLGWEIFIFNENKTYPVTIEISILKLFERGNGTSIVTIFVVFNGIPITYYRIK
jgi:hypothetical protein